MNLSNCSTVSSSALVLWPAASVYTFQTDLLFHLLCLFSCLFCVIVHLLYVDVFLSQYFDCHYMLMIFTFRWHISALAFLSIHCSAMLWISFMLHCLRISVYAWRMIRCVTKTKHTKIMFYLVNIAIWTIKFNGTIRLQQLSRAHDPRRLGKTKRDTRYSRANKTTSQIDKRVCVRSRAKEEDEKKIRFLKLKNNKNSNNEVDKSQQIQRSSLFYRKTE